MMLFLLNKISFMSLSVFHSEPAANTLWLLLAFKITLEIPPETHSRYFQIIV